MGQEMSALDSGPDIEESVEGLLEGGGHQDLERTAGCLAGQLDRPTQSGKSSLTCGTGYRTDLPAPPVRVGRNSFPSPDKRQVETSVLDPEDVVGRAVDAAHHAVYSIEIRLSAALENLPGHILSREGSTERARGEWHYACRKTDGVHRANHLHTGSEQQRLDRRKRRNEREAFPSAGPLGVSEEAPQEGATGTLPLVLREDPHFRQNPLAGSDVSRPETQGLVPIQGTEEAVRIVRLEVGELRVEVTLEIEVGLPRGDQAGRSGNRLFEDLDPCQLFPVSPADLDGSHHSSSDETAPTNHETAPTQSAPTTAQPKE